MRNMTLLGVALLLAATAAFAIACGDDDGSDSGDLSDTPTAISLETQSDATEPAAGETEPAGGETPEATEGDGDDEPVTSIDVNLTEYILAPAVDTAPAGPLTFTGMNIGGNDHELIVIKTDLAPESLPTRTDGSVDPEGAGIEVIDETGIVAPQTEEELDVELEAGAYVLICNVVDGTTSHYAEGMRAPFTVQ